MNESQIAKYEQAIAPAAAGDESQATMMVQFGQLYGIPAEDLSPENVGALAKVATWSRELGYLPGTDIGMIPFSKSEQLPNGEWIKKKVYQPYVTYDRWKTNAAIGAREEGVFLAHEIEELTPEEVKTRVEDEGDSATGPYHDGDRGARCRLVRVLGEREFKTEWHYGFWRVNANKIWVGKGKHEWKPDNIPSQRSRQWVANKRAHQSAIKSQYGMYPAQSRVDQQLMIDRVALMANQAERERSAPPERPIEHEQAMTAFRQLQREDDGDVLFAEEPAAQNGRKPEPEDAQEVVDASYTVVGDGEAPDIVHDENAPDSTRQHVAELRAVARSNAKKRRASDAATKAMMGYISEDPEDGPAFLTAVFGDAGELDQSTTAQITRWLNPSSDEHSEEFRAVVDDVLIWTRKEPA